VGRGLIQKHNDPDHLFVGKEIKESGDAEGILRSHAGGEVGVETKLVETNLSVAKR
jgi:hypothetical protein